MKRDYQKLTIDETGFLHRNRKKLLCPFSPPTDGSYPSCGDWCPHFGIPEVSRGTTSLALCHGLELSCDIGGWRDERKIDNVEDHGKSDEQFEDNNDTFTCCNCGDSVDWAFECDRCRNDEGDSDKMPKYICRDCCNCERGCECDACQESKGDEDDMGHLLIADMGHLLIADMCRICSQGGDVFLTGHCGCQEDAV